MQSIAAFEPDEDVPGEYSKCWPKDWLPLDCPGVRIIAVNYSTDPFLWKPFWIHAQQRLVNTSLIEEKAKNRPRFQENPKLN